MRLNFAVINRGFLKSVTHMAISKRFQLLLTFSVVLGLTAASPIFAQMSYPMVMSLKPVAIQVGATTECEVNSRYTMLGAYQVTVGGSGVIAEVVPPVMPELKPGEKPKDVTKLKVKFTATADALPGVRPGWRSLPP